jgi:hypothetical protein
LSRDDRNHGIKCGPSSENSSPRDPDEQETVEENEHGASAFLYHAQVRAVSKNGVYPFAHLMLLSEAFAGKPRKPVTV